MRGNRNGAGKGPSKNSTPANLSTRSWSGQVPPDVKTPGRYLPTTVSGAPAIETTPVSPREVFGADLPPRGFVPFYRANSFAATSVTSVPIGGFFEVVIEKVPNGTGLLIYDIEYKWLEDGTDPLDANALSEMQSMQAINGTITFDVLVDGAPYVNNDQQLYDPSTSTVNTRRGFAKLNTNLLAFGNSPSVLYVKQNQTLTARFYHNRTPGNPPTSIYVCLRGYSCPFTNFQKVQRKTRTI